MKASMDVEIILKELLPWEMTVTFNETVEVRLTKFLKDLTLKSLRKGGCKSYNITQMPKIF